MNTTIARLHTRILTARDRLTHALTEDRGSLSVEQVVITVGVLALAVLVVGAITAFVKGKIGSIA